MFRPTRYKFRDTQEIKIKYNFKNLQLVKLKRQNNSRFQHIQHRLRDYDRVHFNYVNILI